MNVSEMFVKIKQKIHFESCYLRNVPNESLGPKIEKKRTLVEHSLIKEKK